MKYEDAYVGLRVCVFDLSKEKSLKEGIGMYDKFLNKKGIIIEKKKF